MPARRVSTLMISVALVAFGACSDGGSGRDATKTRPASRSTTPGPVIPVARTEVAGAFWDGKIAGAGDKVYAIAGRNPGGAVRAVESFIIGSDQWNDEGALHDARSGMGAGTTSSGRVCTGGGEVPGRPDTVPSIECYDGGRWRRVANMSVPRHGLAVVAEGKRVHLVAGGPQPGFSFSDAHEVLQL